MQIFKKNDNPNLLSAMSNGIPGFLKESDTQRYERVVRSAVNKLSPSKNFIITNSMSLNLNFNNGTIEVSRHLLERLDNYCDKAIDDKSYSFSLEERFAAALAHTLAHVDADKNNQAELQQMNRQLKEETFLKIGAYAAFATSCIANIVFFGLKLGKMIPPSKAMPLVVTLLLITCLSTGILSLIAHLSKTLTKDEYASFIQSCEHRADNEALKLLANSKYQRESMLWLLTFLQDNHIPDCQYLDKLAKKSQIKLSFNDIHPELTLRVNNCRNTIFGRFSGFSEALSGLFLFFLFLRYSLFQRS